MIIKKFFLLIFFFELNQTIYILPGIKTLNKFLYSSRYKEYNNQNKLYTCSLKDGPNCFFTENKYIENFNKMNKDDIINKEWVNFYNKTKKYEYHKIVDYLNNHTNNYIVKNIKKVDKEQNSEGEVFKYLMTFDNFDEYTIKKDTYFDEKLNKNIFYNKEINIDIKGKLKLSYDKDQSEYYLNVIDKDYPSNTFGIIESNFISISFGGKVFVCDFFYIKAHNKKNKSDLIYFYGYIGNKIVYTYSYNDNKERKEKWLKVHFPMATPINYLVISGPYDIDNISFTFPNKKYADSNVYNMYNYKNIKILINDEDI